MLAATDAAATGSLYDVDADRVDEFPETGNSPGNIEEGGME